MPHPLTTQRSVTWLARVILGIVFAVNVWCAIAFIVQPDYYVAGFEIAGVPGRTMVQGLGILFLMWNATYPPVLLHPNKQMTLFGVILIQQSIGVVGETWLWLTLAPGHLALAETGLRFMLFDGVGLILLGIVYALLGQTMGKHS